jgi:D-alanyl-D-alanine carboxypeptidase/D-alanyl-D-alanine-endopeptidase (penicillin-binding protein 4)
MRRQLAIAVLGAVLGMPQLSLAAEPAGFGAVRQNTSRRPLGPKALTHKLNRDLDKIDGLKGAYVLDLTTGQALYAKHATAKRMPASVQKLYTTTIALLRLGPSAVLTTSVLGTGRLGEDGTWHGTLYLRGGGDPSFGSHGFDHAAYGTGATMGELARAVRNAGIRRLAGRIVGDESRFDSLRGTAATDFRPSFYLEGQLSALAYDRGFSNSTWTAFQPNPPNYAARRFRAALRTAGVRVPSDVSIRTGVTPHEAKPLAEVSSPALATLIGLINTPSDDFFAEMLLKDLGASFGGGGTTAAGVGVVHRALKHHFHIKPRFNDGSGLSRSDSTSPRQVVTLLRSMYGNTYFVDSLAIAGETGTLVDEMRGTRAQGNCRGKTGTLHDVASLAGYCTARNGDILAFAFLLNGLTNSDYGHTVEAKMAVALANYDG